MAKRHVQLWVTHNQDPDGHQDKTYLIFSSAKDQDSRINNCTGKQKHKIHYWSCINDHDKAWMLDGPGVVEKNGSAKQQPTTKEQQQGCDWWSKHISDWISPLKQRTPLTKHSRTLPPIQRHPSIHPIGFGPTRCFPTWLCFQQPRQIPPAFQ